jgi:hypothetical protein
MLKILRELPFFLIASTANAEPPFESEVCLYRGTPADVMVAAPAARQGHTVSLVAINAHTGGVG